MQAVSSEWIEKSRLVEQIEKGVPTSDGGGVRLTRFISQRLQRRFDPFLMLDIFCTDNPNDYIAGFPDHPHRGFETITYMIEGRMRHRDSAGHEGLLDSGGAQWMTTGRGVIHSEMPEQKAGAMRGFQLWLNLPAKDKLCEPWYRDFQQPELPAFETEQAVKVVVVAGVTHGVTGAVTRSETKPLILDISLPGCASFTQQLPVESAAFLYVMQGSVAVANDAVQSGELALFANDGGDGIRFESGNEATRVFLIAGIPLCEPIAQYGPFVMNTEQEIYQAVADYREGRFAAA